MDRDGQLAYDDAVAELEGRGIMPVRMPSLEPMQRALARTGLKIPPRRNLIVAGTNGKGSVAATLSRLLTDQGLRVGLYTSPHLITTRERFRIGDEDLSEAAFVALHREITREREGGPWAKDLTHFEALTLMAALAFWGPSQEGPVDWAIWEVGLGGLFDATNAIPHHFCAITSLGMDHQNLLGATLPEIARQKWGVIPPGGRVVSAPLAEELREAWAAHVQATRCEGSFAPSAGTPWKPVSLALAGPRGESNTRLALAVFEALGFDPGVAQASLPRVRWPGRLSPLPGFVCPAWVSGDHNLPGVESLIEALQAAGTPWETLHLIVGIGRDKEAGAMLRLLNGLPRVALYLTETPFKPLPIQDYPPCGARFAHPDPGVVLKRVRAIARPADQVGVTGSLYLVGKCLGDC